MTKMEINAEPRKPFNLTLVGEEYMVFPPKTMMSMLLAKASKSSDGGTDVGQFYEGLSHWLTAAFGRKVAPKVIKRLEDPEDDLDIDHIMQLIEKMTEGATGNPTT